MKAPYQILIITSPESSLLPSLQQLFNQDSQHRVKLFAPSKIYRTDLKEANCIILDYDHFLNHADSLNDIFQFMDKVGIVATLTDHEQMAEILKKTKASHLFGMSGTSTLQDLKNHIITCMNQEFWNAESLVNSPALKKTHVTIQSSALLDQQIESAISAHDFSKTFEEFRTILIQILNETLTNALYNAPIDSQGNFLHRHQNRRTVIESDPARAPTLDIFEDDEKLVVSVKDYYGTLTKEVADHFLTHGEISEKKGGAGVGIYLVLKHAHKVIINIDPGTMTEFIVVLHKFKRFYHYQTLEKSYHFYQRKKQ